MFFFRLRYFSFPLTFLPLFLSLKERKKKERVSKFSSPSLTYFSCHSIPSSFFHFRVNKNLSFFQRFKFCRRSVFLLFFLSLSFSFSSSLFFLPLSFFGTKEGEKKNEGKSRTNIFREQKEEGNRNEKERKRKKEREGGMRKREREERKRREKGGIRKEIMFPSKVLLSSSLHPFSSFSFFGPLFLLWYFSSPFLFSLSPPFLFFLLLDHQ